MIVFQTPVPLPIPVSPGVAAQNCGTFDLSCHVGAAAGSVFDSLVGQVAQGAAQLVVTMSSWWITTDSVNPQDSAVLAAQGATRYLIGAILVGSVLVQAVRLIISRKAEPLFTVVTGLVRFAAVSALGLVVLQAALRAGDAFATSILNGAANNFAFLMRDLLTGDHTEVSTFVVFLVALIAAVAAVVQWMLMMIRQAGLLVLAALLPLAAAGSLNRSTRGWLNKLGSWLIALVIYKPAAAFIYYIGFSYLSSPASNQPGSVSTMLTGCVVLLLAVVAMPALLRFFAWTGTQIGGGGGGSGVLGAAGAAAMSQSYRGSRAVNRAAATEASGPASGPAGATAAARAGAGAGAGVGGSAAAAGPAGAAVVVATAAAAKAKQAAQGAASRMTDDGAS